MTHPSSSESGLSGFFNGTMIHSSESRVSETMTESFSFGMMQCIVCVLGTANMVGGLAGEDTSKCR